ncbi:hypothetical protein VTN00DRAFT_8953 [Thermoascus crustaceus]|uniref:uncharacterized protein n=1 Tax=Thermoascus crustaceus TaxID=5088 RepID=UPI003743D05B
MKFELPTIHVTQPKSAFAEGNARWTNLDLDPIPRHRRKWGVTSFIGMELDLCVFASSMLAVGMSYRDSLVVVAISFLIVSFVISGNGAVGAIYHVPFPVIARASWGFWGSYVAIISRVILAVFWFAIQQLNGANAVKVMIGAIWPSFLTLKNDILENQGITTNGMVSYFIFWLIQLPFICMHPNKLRWLFMAKSLLVPVAWIAILIWAFVAESGGDLFDKPSTLKGSAYSWLFLANLTSTIGNYATLSVNQSDFSRYSRVSVNWQLLYVPMLPIVFTFIAFIGLTASSAGHARYGGEIPWDPTVLISYWSSRACRFFAAFSFALASLGVNISANSLSAANDFMALAPRYINLRRGQLLCAFLSWCLVPWKILESAGSFLNFMSAYAVFLGPIAAIMLWDYWIVKRRKYNTLALYQPWSIYSFCHGVNWRSIVAFICGVAPNLPGLISSVNSHIDVGVGIHPYQFGWLLGFAGTSLVYVILSYLFPVKEALVERAVLPDEIYDSREVVVEGVEPIPGTDDEKAGTYGARDAAEIPEKTGFKKFIKAMDRIL